jgi:glucokinase
VNELDTTSEVIAIDVGGTLTKAARIDVGGVARELVSVPTPVAQGTDGILELVVDLAKSFEGRNVMGVSVVVPGIVDSSEGVARHSVNLGWREWPLRDLLQERLAHRVCVGHDVTAAGEAEMRTGEGLENGVVIVIGTGIASVLVSNHEIMRGAHGTAGELGHVVVRDPGVRCRCGSSGCLEAYASAGALATRYRDIAGGAVDVVDVVDAEWVIREAAHNHYAHEAWTQAIDCLAKALAMVISVQDPGKIIIAGGLSLAGDTLITPLVESLETRLTERSVPPIVLSRYRQHAGVVGAAIQFYRPVGGVDFSSWMPWSCE